MVFVKYHFNRSPKMRTKKFKKFTSILAIANYRKWLDASPPLSQCSH